MRRLVMVIGVAAMLGVLGSSPARAAAQAQTMSLGSDATVTVAVVAKSSDAVLGLSAVTPASTTVCSACTVGAGAALGTFPAGTEIVLRLDQGNQSFLSTNADHARIAQTADGWRIDWDDAYPHRDYDDLVVTVSAVNTAPPTPPTPLPAPPEDRDADGVSPPADCMDTNSLVRPGAPEVAGNGLDDDCAGGDAPGRIVATVKTTWVFGRRSARIKLMEVRNAPAGATVALSCRGKGCPFKRRTVVADSLGKRNLTRLFRPPKLRVGSRLEIAITAPNLIGRVILYRIRSNAFPRQQDRCLPPGAPRPVAC